MNIKKIFLFFILSISTFASIYDTKVDYKKYPNSSVAVFLDESDMILNKDNSYEIKNRIVKKILNYKGKKEHSEYKIYYDNRYETIKILSAFTIKPDGKKIEVPKNEIKVLDSPDSYWKLDFAVENVMVVSFKSVEIDDIVEINYIRKNNKKDKIADYSIFASDEGTYEKKITFKYPKDKYIDFSEENFTDKIEKTEKIEGDSKIVVYDMKNLDQYLPEEDMPRLNYIYPTLYYTMYKNWQDYLDEIKKIYLDNLVATPKILEEVAKVVDLKASKYEQVEQLKNYFAKNIALIPVNNLRAFKIRNYDEILSKKYGTSFERVMLFGMMLDYLGIKNKPIIIGEKENYFEMEKKYRNVSYFNYMIIQVEIDGEKYYIDPVSEFLRLEEFNQEDLIGIPVQGKLEFLKINPKKVNTKTSDYVIKVDNQGNADVDRFTSYEGRGAALLREKYKYMTGIDKRKDYEAVLSGISLNVKPISEERDIDLGKTVKIKFSYHQDNLLVRTGKYEYFDLPVSINPFVFSLSADERKYPMENKQKGIYKRNIKLTIPSSKEIVEKPEEISVENEVFSLKRKVKMQNNILTITDVMQYKPNILSLEKYKNLYKVNLELSRKKQTRILLKEKK